jgi:uncharacterized protein (DUF2141 family)
MIWKLATVGSLYVSALTAAGAADLTLTISSVQNASGSVVAGLFNSANNFPRAGQALASFRMKAAKGDLSFTIHNLPPGKYAAVAFHDENDNGTLDVDPLGMPTEGYGVSNDAREPDGPPQYAKAAFDVAEQHKSVTVKLNC